MSAQALWERVEMAWTVLSGRRRHRIHPSRSREERPAPRGDEPPSSKEGFVEEALPWLDAVYRFALRLVEGDRDDRKDLARNRREYREIAEVLGVPVGTVKSRLFRARRLLQDRLREFAVRAGYLEEDVT